MQSTVLWLLGAVLAVSALATWLGFTGRRRYYRRYRAVAAIGVAVLTPYLTFVLVRQSKAPDEVRAWGIALHPATVSAWGLPTPNAEGGTWAFSVAAPADSIREFYLDPAHARDWTLALIHPKAILYEREGRSLLIRLRDGARHPTVIFTIGPADS
jgi:hypothetical protein